MFKRYLSQALVAAALLAPATYAQDARLDTVRAGRFDNGKMWTFDQPPLEYFRETYGFAPEAAWFEQARLGALRLPNCTASFVSPHGLVMTNHHCGRGQVAQVSLPGEELLEEGFYARDLADERRVPGLYVDQLIAITDVTAEVETALEGQETAAERASARQEAFQRISQRLQGEAGEGHTVQVISLYNGSRFSAYTFRRYTDVRLVMAPELTIGYFGGDTDNFTYPRYTLDMTFFRVYENDRPFTPQAYFRWSTEGSREGDAVFVIGNPGSTNRLETTSQLAWRRDVQERALLDFVSTTRSALQRYYDAADSPPDALRNQIFGLSNTEKLYTGRVKGLDDAYLMARRLDAERNFRRAIEEDATLRDRYRDLFDRIEEVQRQKQELAPEYAAFIGLAPQSPNVSATMRRAIVAQQWLAQGQPDALRQQLLNIPNQPRGLDEALLVNRLRAFEKYLGQSSIQTSEGSGTPTPESVAAALLTGSVLADSARTAAALQSGALDANDPAIRFAASFAERRNNFISAFTGLTAQEQDLLAEVGRARFAVYGFAEPPDATFSLRMADGVVAGYEMNGTVAPAYTTFHGMYDRYATAALRPEGPTEWALPERWLNPPTSFDRSTPLNLVTTNDIIGGNSGSPLLNTDLEVVGLIFDGNIESLPSSFIYQTMGARAVAVDVRGMREALDEIYDMDRIVLELTRGDLVETEAAADRQ